MVNASGLMVLDRGGFGDGRAAVSAGARDPEFSQHISFDDRPATAPLPRLLAPLDGAPASPFRRSGALSPMSPLDCSRTTFDLGSTIKEMIWHPPKAMVLNARSHERGWVQR